MPPPSPPDAPPNIVETVLSEPALLAEILKRAAAERPAEPIRHDGWTGERMATFLQVLADTGIVAEGCRLAGMSRDSAYALRNRDPVFAAAWAAAQSKARPLIADGMLERSITGTVEHYYRDGKLVGERRHYESWLGLAMLKRLDRLAEQERAEASLSAKIEGDWQAALNALREGGTAAVAPALEPETDEPDIPPSPPGYDPWESVWRDEDQRWMTIFPPPPGFDGYENRPYDGFNYYRRACTADEAELLEANEEAGRAEEREEVTAMSEAERDAFFADLRAEVRVEAQPRLEPEPAFSMAEIEDNEVPDEAPDDEGAGDREPC